ncbi:LCP family protein [Janibacter sp. G56]|uniref:LCP family protein n=1 Tax=Janibacter sp. G56 TaxID=3418717 RepID=UPI003CFFF602
MPTQPHRPIRRRDLLACLGGGAMLAACSAPDESQDGTPPSATSSSSTPPASSTSSTSDAAARGLTVVGGPAALARAVEPRYAAEPAVKGRAHLGSWKGDRVAVVTVGKDVTLAVESGTSWKVVGGWWPSLGQDAPRVGSARHVLVLGSDARPGQKVSRSRGDAIQLLGVDGDGGGGVLGFARDLWVPIAGGGQSKINAALSLHGPDAMRRTVSDLTDIPISGYVLTGFAGFTRMVDDLGQIPFTSPEAWTGIGVNLTVRKGYQRFNGREALAYARERKVHPGGDFDRSRNQGRLLAAAAKEARAQGAAVLPKALSVLSRFCESDLDAAQMLTFAAAVLRARSDRFGAAVAKGPTGMSSDGQSIVRLDDASRAAFRSFRSGALPRG